MPNRIVQGKTIHLNMTGVSFMTYANRYREAAMVWLPTSQKMEGFDPVSYYLFCLSLELHLKSFIWLKDQIPYKEFPNRYGHRLIDLWSDAKFKGINKFAKVTPLRDSIILLVGPYYKKRQFNYLDLEMVFAGFKDLKSEPRIIPTLSRLTEQLGKSLKSPILKQSQQ